MRILFFLLERGGRWGSSPSTSPGDHQKLNVIQKWAFYFLAGEGWQMGFESIDQLNQSSEVELNPKISILFFGCRGVVDRVQVHWPAQPIIRSWTWSKNKHLIFFFTGEGWQMGFESINQSGWLSEVECNPKLSILFFWLERGGWRG